MHKKEDNLWIVSHPYADIQLSCLRDKNTQSAAFRESLRNLGRICGYELMKLLEIENYEIITPLGKCTGTRLADERNVIVVNVLRAALPFSEGIMEAFPKARQGFISARRIEEKREGEDFVVEVKYSKIPPIIDGSIIIIADTMLASASTLIKIMGHVKLLAKNTKSIFSLSAIASEYGMERARKAFSDVSFITCAIDPFLNENGYIVPGLGDAGDRAFF